MKKCWNDIGVFGLAICDDLNIYGHCRHCPKYSEGGRSLLDREIPGGLIDEWTEKLTKGKKELADSYQSLVVFKINGELLAMPSSGFQEIISVRQVHTVPFRSDKVFRGLVNVNGELLLCINSAGFFGFNNIPEEKNPNPVMAVLKNDQERYVFEVDSIVGVVQIYPASITNAPSTVGKSPKAFTRGIFKLKENDVGIIDEVKLFSELDNRITW